MGTQFIIDPDQIASPSYRMEIFPVEADSSLVISTDLFPGVDIRISKTLAGISTFSASIPPVNNSTQLYGGELINVIPMMSTVLIKMTRGAQDYVVFVGVVTNTEEQEIRTEGGPVQRSTLIEGQDLMYFLTRSAQWSLTWAGTTVSAIPGGPSGQQFFGTNATGSPFTGTPAEMGTGFYNAVIRNYLHLTNFKINSTEYAFDDMLSVCFGPFATPTNLDIIFPFLNSFYQADGVWWDKLKVFFPWPVYEMFMETYEILGNATPVHNAATVSLTGATTIETPTYTPSTVITIDSASIPNTTAGGQPLFWKDETGKTLGIMQPTLVARQMPHPRAISTDGVWSLDRSAWDALPEYVFKSTATPYYASAIQFSIENVRSLYAISASTIAQTFGSNINLLAPFILTEQSSLVDPVAMSKFGYIPEIMDIAWFFAPTLAPNQKNLNTDAMVELMSTMTTTLSSYYVPVSLMASGNLELPLTPSILVGTKITFAPQKVLNDNATDGNSNWTFYVEGVQHVYEFGGKSRTVLTLSRGLPTAVYENDNLLLAMLQGLVERIRQAGTPGSIFYREISNPEINGLTGLTFIRPDNVNTLYQELSNIYLTPQAA